MGDADYDYRNITGQSKMIVPTLQIGTINSHATDDRYVAFNGVIPEMATGRFPARSASEVSDFSDKIIEFEIDKFKKKCLLEGLDDIALSLENIKKISSYEVKISQNKPWIE